MQVNSWRLAAWISAGFSLLVGLILIGNFAISKRDDPLRSIQLKELKQKLQATPANEEVKQQIRKLDLKLREKYFKHLAQMRVGSYLLAGGVAIFLITAARAFRIQKALPGSESLLITSSRAFIAKARWSVIAASGAVAGLLLVLSLGHSRAVPKLPDNDLASRRGGPPTVADYASTEEIAANWPRFLGPNGNGFSRLASAPTNWDVKSGNGIAWRIPAPAVGFNSPIVWKDRVFLSGGDAIERSVFCLDRRSGQVLWQKAIAKASATGASAPEVSESTGYAASSMVTDGKRVFVIFATGDLAALDLNGAIAWSKCLAPLKNSYGHASSLLTWKGRLFAQVDQGESEQAKSRLYAFDGRTGEVLWQQVRRVGSSWSTPTLVENGGKMQIVATAVPRVNAYAADTGAELWQVEGINGEVTPSLVAFGELVFAVSPSEKLMAIRANGTGDVTKTHIAWSSEDFVPDISSPATDGELLFTLSTGGLVTCYDVKDGKKLWDHDYDSEFHASPAIAGRNVYLFSLKGHAVVVEAARQFKEVFRTEMPDTFISSPAFAQENVFLRGATNVWCVGPVRGQMAGAADSGGRVK
jgi:outer membrane protein assembly factor BamB